jgi:GT2 family glycosyltransferase
MSKKSNISLIVPVHELTDDTKTYFPNAIQSVKEQIVKPDELIIVVPKGSDVADYVKSFEYGELTSSVVIAENEGNTDFASQFNYGVSIAKSEWVSLLEFDDELAKIWFKNVIEYAEAYPEVGIFMPIVVDVDASSQFIGFTNEAVWAQSFSDELGILDNNALLAYQNFNVDGMVIKKSLIEEFGGFKSNVKLTFIYEFLLRMTFKAIKTMVIPRFGYKHLNQRPNSLFASYKDTMNPNEAKWWLAQAKKEYYFSKDRSITYLEQTV